MCSSSTRRILLALLILGGMGTFRAQAGAQADQPEVRGPSLLVVATGSPDSGSPESGFSGTGDLSVFEAGSGERLHSLMPASAVSREATGRQMWPVFSEDGQRCCVVANPDEGILRGYVWDGTQYRHVADLDVGVGVVDLQVTQGGTKIVVLSRETTDPWDAATAYLRVVDFIAFEVVSTIPLGAPVELRDESASSSTHQLAVDDQGFAYVAVERSQIRPVNLVTQKLWDLYTPGRGFDTGVVDLRVIDGTLYTLCRGLEDGTPSSCLDWIDPISGANGRIELTFEGRSDLGLSLAHGVIEGTREVIFVHGQRAVSVIDRERHERLDAIAMPEGASEIAVSQTLPGLVVLVPGRSPSEGLGGRPGRLHFIRLDQRPWQVSRDFVVLEAGSELRYLSQSSLEVLPHQLGEIIATMVPDLSACLLVELDRYGRPAPSLPQYKILQLEGRPSFLTRFGRDR